jgi:hypothetical protein
MPTLMPITTLTPTPMPTLMPITTPTTTLTTLIEKPIQRYISAKKIREVFQMDKMKYQNILVRRNKLYLFLFFYFVIFSSRSFVFVCCL